MASPLSSLRHRLARAQVAREKRLPLDSARYVAVSSGRLEPYLRTLAAVDVWTCEPPRVSNADDGIAFVSVWATRPRAVLATPGDAPAPDLVARSLVDILADHPGAGAVVDPDRDTELTVEPHHAATISALKRGEAIAEAFSAIGVEELAATEPYRSLDSAAEISPCDDRERAAIAQLPEGLSLHRVEVHMLANPAGPRPYRVYFVQAGDGTSPPLDASMCARLEAVLGPTRVLVNPGTPDWRRDVLWDFRGWAIPLQA
ncbi:hypothetical protein H8R18_08810 [Nanchangia anserum]|uniref:Uncharacterized protein n=1 Tax=Nanchangia anserum TaxID=2692125 RepID=A0A8I0G825_9ACTO|nr:hypothetical protein [Nanchangia anserum]MBD3689610.1 hypothetical protein [Nanchangia anserum]QOX81793.1 hypothetical protein H8R18_08810 [Nanchangia anserum]